MKYFSIDVETCGLSPRNDTLLQVGIVFEDTEDCQPIAALPKLNIFIDAQRIEGTPFAIGMNQPTFGTIRLLKQCRETYENGEMPTEFDFDECTISKDGAFVGTVCSTNTVLVLVKAWTHAHAIIENYVRACLNSNDEKIYICVAGKNYMGFDHRFIKKNSVLPGCVRVSQRTLDPAILYTTADDKFPPNLQECLDRAKIQGVVSHDAIGDAIDVIKLFRAKDFPSG